MIGRAALSVLAVIALILVVSGTAQASEWVIDGKALSEFVAKKESVSISGGAVQLSVAALGLTVKCEKAEGTGTILSGGADELSISLTKCEVAEGPVCKVSEPVVATAKTELIHAGAFFYDKITAKTGEVLATVVFKGEECALPEKNILKGAVAAEVPAEEGIGRPAKLSEKISKEANKALKAEGKAEFSLIFGTQAAFLSGELTEKLSGANTGKEWQRVPPTKLCKKLEKPCAAGETYAIGTTLTAERETESKFVFGALEPACKVSKLSGTTTAAGPPLAGSFTTVEFKECGGGACPVTAERTPFTFEIHGDKVNGNGFIVLRGTGGNLEFKIECGGKTCLYGAPKVTFSVTGGDPRAKFARQVGLGLAKEAGSEAACPNNAQWEGVAAVGEPIKYEFLAPTPMFVTE